MKCSVFPQWILFAIALVASSAHGAVADGSQDVAFLENYCVKCHGADEENANVRLDQLALHITHDNHELWKEVVRNIQLGAIQAQTDEQSIPHFDLVRCLFIDPNASNRKRLAGHRVGLDD